jgi:hypothetical protein
VKPGSKDPDLSGDLGVGKRRSLESRPGHEGSEFRDIAGSGALGAKGRASYLGKMSVSPN